MAISSLRKSVGLNALQSRLDWVDSRPRLEKHGRNIKDSAFVGESFFIVCACCVKINLPWKILVEYLPCPANFYRCHDTIGEPARRCRFGQATELSDSGANEPCMPYVFGSCEQLARSPCVASLAPISR